MLSSNNFLIYSAKILTEVFWELVYFPLWWYTAGAELVVKSLFNFVAEQQRALGFWVWLKNIYRPMYGQNDWAGILISFLVRLFQVIVRGIAMLIIIAFAWALFLLWLAFPVLVIYEIIFQLI